MNPQEINETVRRAYGAAAQGAASCCSSPSREKTLGARTSFGCGDPLALAGVGAGQTVLDVGSGPGADALEAARRVGPAGRVIGVDMTEEMLARARRSARAEGLHNVEFRAGDAESLPVEDSSVDWVISNCVVNLVPDKEKAFREILRVLKPGGSFQITDLIGENLPREILDDPARYCACVGGAPSESLYLEAIRKAGFERVEVLDRSAWEAAELAGTGARVWSLKVRGRRPAGEAPPQRVETARSEDLPAITELLERAGLPVEEVAEHLDGFIVARGAGAPGAALLGCAGMERHGSACVLRSLAVLPEARGRGVARLLLDELTARARRAGCSDAYLLTLNLERAMARRGFRRIAREEVPAPVLASREFSLACCSAAAVMRLRLV